MGHECLKTKAQGECDLSPISDVLPTFYLQH